MKIQNRRRNLLTAVLPVFLMFNGCSTQISESTAEEKEKPALEVINDDSGDLFREAEQKLQVQEETKAELFQISEVNTEKKDYTVMVYIIGSDLESRGGQATKDIEEMRRSGLDYENTNLVLYTGGARRWVSDIPNDKNCVIDMKNGETVDIIASTESTADMGSPETLREFLNFCTENYPAEHYGLILWDHGGGPLWGYGSDQLFGNDSLILNELKKAMDQTEFGKEKKLDFVGFDACLMGTAENANLWKNYADYFVASEELEPGGGWDYSFLSILNETDDTEKIITEIVDSYGRSIENARSEYFNPEYTLSAMDLSKTEEMVNAVNELSLRMSEEIEEGRYSYLRKIRGEAREFGRGHSYDLVDLCHFAEQLSERYPEEAAALQEAVRNMTIAKTGNIEEAEGLSLYLPAENRELLEAAGKFMDENTDLSETYRNFMDAYEEKWLSGGREDWMLADPVLEGDEITLQLTEEQAEGTSAFASFLVRFGNGYFGWTTIHLPFKCDENGVVRIPSDPYLMSMETEDGSMPSPVRCTVTASDDNGTEFETLSTYALSGMEFLRDFINIAGEKVKFKIYQENGKDECLIRDITTDTSAVTLDGKGSVDISDYESISDYLFGYIPETDETGAMKPFYNWSNRDWKGLYTLPADEGIRFRMRRASEFNKDFVCQILLKDSSGNIYASKYIDLPRKQDENIIQTKTENGVLTFDLYDDHAELTSYTGTDTKLVIPDEVEGKPVTALGEHAVSSKELEELVFPSGLKRIGAYGVGVCSNLKTADFPDGLKEIGDYAFMDCPSLTEAVIPDSVERIGRGAFLNCGFTSVTLPENLWQIGSIPFADCEKLEEIQISSKNAMYQTIDGVLFTKDGKELIQYPAARGETYTVPDGTEVIAYGAFAMNRIDNNMVEDIQTLKDIRFPESLKEIGNMAFYDCIKIRSLQLPESLKKIGDFAFGCENAGTARIYFDSFPSIRIPAGVESIGRFAFSGLLNASFEVDEKNPYYASSGGFITNKHKDTLLYTPSGIGSVIRIPEGITTLTDYVFWDTEREADFIIPDSVFRFPQKVFHYSIDRETNETIYNVKIHCSEGSAAEEYAERYSIPYDNDPQSAAEEYRIVVIPAGQTDLVFRVYPTHAVLMNTTGEKGDLEIPETVMDVPVTELREDRDYGDEYLQKYFLTVRIPSSVTVIDSSFLDGVKCAAYESSSESYQTKDGVLFNKDGTVLLKYPQDRQEEEYTIPEGTEVIGENSIRPALLKRVRFADSVTAVQKNAFAYVKEVYFNEGLKEIGDYAFMSCSNLESIILPDSLEKLGRKAFDLTYSETDPEVRIPEHLKFIEDNAVVFKDVYMEELCLYDLCDADFPMFPGLRIGKYVTDEDNPYCSVVDGMLMTKDKKGLCAVPSGMEGECRIPYGTELVDPDAFSGCTEITDVYFPDTVYYGADSLPKDENGKLTYTVHCVPGSEMARELTRRNLDWVEWDGH